MTNLASTYSFEVLESIKQLHDFIPRWERFLSNASAPHFYQDLEKILIEKRYRERSSELLIIAIKKDDEIVAIAPLLPERRPFKVKLGLFTLASFKLRRHKLLGSGIVFSEQADRGECVRQLTQILKKQGHRFDFLIVDELSEDSSLLAHSNSLLPYVIKPVNPKSEIVRQLHMPESYDALMAGYTGKKRSEQRRRARIMAKHFDGDLELIRITKPEQVQGFIEASHTIFDQSWKKGVLGDAPGYSRSDIPYLEHLAEKGWLRSYLLMGKGEPVAYFANFVYHDNCVLDDLGFDKRFKKLGPGSVMIFLIIQDMYEYKTPKLMDFGYGDNTYKRVYSNFNYQANESYIVKRPGLSWLLVEAQVALRRLYTKIHQLLIYMNLDKTVRKLIKN